MIRPGFEWFPFILVMGLAACSSGTNSQQCPGGYLVDDICY